MHFCTRDLGSPGFSGIFDFAVCGGVLYRFAYDRGPFSVIFLHILQTYRCLPRLGFSADISFDIFIGISIDIFIGSSIIISLTFIDKEEGGGRKEWIFS